MPRVGVMPDGAIAGVAYHIYDAAATRFSASRYFAMPPLFFMPSFIMRRVVKSHAVTLCAQRGKALRSPLCHCCLMPARCRRAARVLPRCCFMRRNMSRPCRDAFDAAG